MERLRVLVSDLQAGLGLPANPHQASTGAIILARMTSAFGSVSVRRRVTHARVDQRGARPAAPCRAVAVGRH